MQYKHRMVFDAYEADLSRIEEGLQIKIKRKKPEKDPQLYTVEVFEDDPEYLEVKARIAGIYPNYFDFKTREYTKEELWNAEMLRVWTNAHRGGYPQPATGGVRNNFMSYSYDTRVPCPRCSVGMKQIKPLRLSGAVKLGRNDISGIFWLRELIINQRLKDMISEAGLTGCEFWPVIRHGKGTEFEDIFQLKILNSMPALDPSTEIFFTRTWENPAAGVCPVCGERRLQHPAHYKRDDINNACDFMVTHEWFGSYLDYWQLPLISQKTYRLFETNKVKGLHYEPVVVID